MITLSYLFFSGACFGYANKTTENRTVVFMLSSVVPVYVGMSARTCEKEIL